MGGGLSLRGVSSGSSYIAVTAYPSRGFGSKSPFSYKFPPMSRVKRRKTDEDEETAEDTQMTPHTPQKKTRKETRRKRRPRRKKQRARQRQCTQDEYGVQKCRHPQKHYMK